MLQQTPMKFKDFLRNIFENFYFKRLKNLEGMDKLLNTYDLPNKNQNI